LRRCHKIFLNDIAEKIAWLYYKVMVKLSANEVKHVAKLAKLDLKSFEIEKFRDQLSRIISHINELSQVNTSKIKPTSQTVNLRNVTRKDKTVHLDSLTQDEALSGTEDVKNGYFKVPAILEKDK
jgi:aspartyl-tRNA(Asn)/glutamyl-tRNA(Gln) amidotransferase subunit C